MSKSDFLSLDDDIDLDALLGDYTEDDDNDVQHKNPQKTPPPAPFWCWFPLSSVQTSPENHSPKPALTSRMNLNKGQIELTDAVTLNE